MAVRFSGSYKPYVKGDLNEVFIEIIDSQGGGELPIRISDFQCFTEGESRDPMTVINPYRVEVEFLIEDDNYASFIDDLANAVVDRFYVKASTGGYEFFAGVVVHDFIEWEDMSYPYVFRINAIDGLTRMRDQDYLDSNGDPYEDEANDHYISMLDHIFNCFEKLNLNNIYDTSYDTKRVWINMNWYDSNMANTTDNPLSMAYAPATMFYEIDNDGNLIAESCYDVLEAILTAFGLRIEFGRGIYRIEQLSERSSGSNHYWNYNFDGTPAGERNQSWNQQIRKEEDSDALPKAVGRFGILPALRQVKVLYEYELAEVAEEPDLDRGFGLAGTGKVCYVYPGLGLLRPVNTVTNIPPPLQFRVHFQLMVKTTYTGNPEDYIDHRYRIRIYLGVLDDTGASNVYKRYVTGFDPELQEPSWEPLPGLSSQTTMAVGGWDYMTPILGFQGASPPSHYLDVGFETTAWPTANPKWVQTFVCAELVEIVTADGIPLGGSYTVEWAVSDLTTIVAQENEKAKPTIKVQEFKSTIVAGGKDSREIKIRFGSKGNSLRVFDGSDLTHPAGWGIGAGGNFELGQLLAQEYHKVRANPIKLMTRTVISRRNRVDNLSQFEYCDAFWVAMITAHDRYKNEITGTWWLLDETRTLPAQATQLTVEIGKEYNRLDDPEPGPLLPLGRNNDLGVDGDGFTANATEFIFRDGTLPDTTTHSEYQIRKKVRVFVNGAKYYYVAGTPVGPRRHGINNTNNSITLDPNFPLSPRHDIEVFLDHG